MFKMEIGRDVKRDNGAGNLHRTPALQTRTTWQAEGQTDGDRDRHRQTDRGRQWATEKRQAGFFSKDKGFPENYEPQLKRHHVGAELARQRGRKTLGPGGEKFHTPAIPQPICLLYFGTSRSKWALHIVYSSVDKNKKKTKTKNAELKLLSNLKFYSSYEYNQLFTLFYGIGVRFQGQLKNHNRQQ